MIPPVQVSPLIKVQMSLKSLETDKGLPGLSVPVDRVFPRFTRYSALLVGMIYGKKRYDYLKPVAAEERRIEEEEKKKREEMERIAKALAEASEDTILK